MTKTVKRYYGDVDLAGNKVLNAVNVMLDGGTAGQVLAKTDGKDYNAQWKTLTAESVGATPSGWGIAGPSYHLPSGTNLNSLVTNGLFYLVGGVNAPAGTEAGYVLVQAFGTNGAYVKQTFDNYANNTAWKRTCNNSVWSEWRSF